MKVIQEYEESDINLTDNKMHSTLSLGILLSSLIMVPQGSNPMADKEAHDKNVRNGVATFLNMLSKQGFTISKTEDIPAAFNF